MKLSQIVNETIHRKLKIGYDMDDVLVDLDQILRQELSLVLKDHTNSPYIPKDMRTGYYFEDIPEILEKTGLNKEILGQLVVKTFGRVFGNRKKDLVPINGIINTINQLKRDGHEITIITARRKSSAPETYEWLNRMGLKDIKVYFAGTGPDRTGPKNSKAKVARLLKLDYFMDDSTENLGQFTKTGQDKITTPIVYDQPWNTKYQGKRLDSHYNTFDLLNNLEK